MKDIKRTALGIAVVATLGFSASAFALRPGCDAPPCGGGGGEDPPVETAAQNLSVPAILVGPLEGLTCDGTAAAPTALMPPTGTPLTGYEVPGYYWVQKVHTWQAQCFSVDPEDGVLVYGNWGDNLEGDAKLKVGSPIRVEIVLTDITDFTGTIPNGTLQGYDVIKLEPNKLDRVSAYGHLAGGADPNWTDIPIDVGQASWVVHDAGIQFSVENRDTDVYVVPWQPISPEINATGKIVYGYNLRVDEPGTYRIWFHTTDNVQFTGQDAVNGGQDDPNTVWIDIEVVPGGGKGGGKP